MAADARKIGFDVRWIDVGNPTEIDTALTRLASSGVNGLVVSDTTSLRDGAGRELADARVRQGRAHARELPQTKRRPIELGRDFMEEADLSSERRRRFTCWSIAPVSPLISGTTPLNAPR
jgi:hypothetical protein